MSYARDRAIADQANERGPLMCAASGCPNRWSVDAGNGRLCSAHAWAPRQNWPSITDEQLDAETDRALFNANPDPKPTGSRAEAMRKLAGLRFNGRGGTEWAEKLRTREESGERLTMAQREMWRTALRWRAGDTDDVGVDGAGFQGIKPDALPEGMRPRDQHHSRAPTRLLEVES